MVTFGFMLSFLVGITIIIFYVIGHLHYLPEESAEDRETREASRKEDRERLVLEYETFNSIVTSRQSSTILIGSIFISASFLILAKAIEYTGFSRILAIIASLVIYGVWLTVFQLTSVRLDNICYRRIHHIEDELKIRVHNYVKDYVGCWISLRRAFWLTAFVILFIFGVFILAFE